MPHYIFATYADVCEEWAIQADSLEHARELIGSGAAAGDWVLDAIHLDAEAVEAREFVLDFDDETPLIEEITSGHWAWQAAHQDEIERPSSRTSPPSRATPARTGSATPSMMPSES